MQYSYVGDDGFISLLLSFKHDFEGHSCLDSKTLRSLSFLQQNLKIGYEILCSKESCQKFKRYKTFQKIRIIKADNRLQPSADRLYRKVGSEPLEKSTSSVITTECSQAGIFLRILKDRIQCQLSYFSAIASVVGVVGHYAGYGQQIYPIHDIP